MIFPLRPFAVFSAALLFLFGSGSAFASHPQTIRPEAIPRAAASAEAPPAAQPEMVVIPGPLRSFLRMAGISQQVTPPEVLPLLARNVFLLGYDAHTETEFLLLLNRYVDYARELQTAAGPDGIIRVTGCDNAQNLVRILGYQFQPACGQKDAYLVTSNPERAFLTTDSGFPLTDLEDALQKHQTFTYSWQSTKVPVLFREREWRTVSYLRRKRNDDLLDFLLNDQNLDRLYWAISKEDPETQNDLRRSPGLRELLPHAAALDFYGSQIGIHSGHILLPGGKSAQHQWEDLVGASASSPGNFVLHLISRDSGWLAAWFDAVSRLPEAQQAHLMQGDRLKRLYGVYAAGGGNTPATRGVFPRNGDLLMLLTNLRWQPNGDPYLPGTLTLWSEILTRDNSPKLVRDWVKRAKNWHSPEQLLMTLVASSAYEIDAGPSQIYLTLSAIDAARGQGPRLSDATVRLLAARYSQLRNWYLIFSEFPQLDDNSIGDFVKAAEALNAVANPTLRSNAMGAFQANIGIWQILARQRQIPPAQLNASWLAAVHPFTAIQSSTQLFDASRNSLRAITAAAGGDPNPSEDQLIDLLAGPPQDTDAGRRMHEQIASRIRSVLDDQRLVSLDTLFGLYDGLDQMAHGSPVATQLIPLAGALREFEMPRAIFTGSERIAWAPEVYSSRHAELQVRTDLTRVIQAPGSPAQLEAARGQLTPFLRDTLVGLNYAYYEPPGAQVLHHNPLFVRSHDFSGKSVEGFTSVWGAPELIGIGVTAGGGAYLIGSLANLPYALATTEEDFISPENVQALIWRAAVPALLVGSVEPRWWSVTPAELHAVALYQRSAEELLQAASQQPELRTKALGILADIMTVPRLEKTERMLADPQEAKTLAPQILPSEKYYLTVEFRKRFPAETAAWGPAGHELDDLIRKYPDDTSPGRISRDFGVPHPTLAQTNACSILGLKPFPAYGGDPYRLLGESWESNNLYWGRLADEMGYSPVTLNVLIPSLTRRMIAKIFATDLDDWPALLRAMRQTGDEFRQGTIRVPGTLTVAEK
jgi:hypothetical protein